MVVIIVSPKFNSVNQVEYFKTISFRKYKYNTILSLRNLILRILVFLLYLPKAKKTEPQILVSSNFNLYPSCEVVLNSYASSIYTQSTVEPGLACFK
jgi:hypothetical protein